MLDKQQLDMMVAGLMFGIGFAVPTTLARLLVHFLTRIRPANK